MQCLRCLRTAIAATPSLTARVRPARSSISSIQQQRSLSILSRQPLRPRLTPGANTTQSALASDETVVTSTTQSTSPVSLPFLQVRGAKRDTYNPSHRVRKRRHGFLSRIGTRTGRMVIKRRQAKKRMTLSH